MLFVRHKNSRQKEHVTQITNNLRLHNTKLKENQRSRNSRQSKSFR